MAAAFDEAVVQGLRLRRPVEQILGDLLRAEAAERRSRSIRYRLGVAGLPVMKDLESFRFDQSPVNAALVRSLHDGTFLAAQRNVVLVGGTGSGKTHLALAITAHVIRAGGAPHGLCARARQIGRTVNVTAQRRGCARSWPC